MQNNTTTKPLNQNRMKTAVEWFFEQLEKDNHLTENEFLRIIQQAKEMEKEQIMDAYKHGRCDEQFKDTLASFYKTTPEQYYNKTFKSE